MTETKRNRYIRILSGLTDTGATLTANATVEVLELLKEPVMDAVPVRYGRWINGKCDKCGGHAPFWAMATTYHPSNFCPNCGARMDGKDGNHEEAD